MDYTISGQSMVVEMEALSIEPDPPYVMVNTIAATITTIACINGTDFAFAPYTATRYTVTFLSLPTGIYPYQIRSLVDDHLILSGNLIIETPQIGIQNIEDTQFSRTTAITTTETTTDSLIVGDCATPITVNLLAATGSNRIRRIANINVGVVTVNGNLADTINGELTQDLNNGDCIDIQDYELNKWIIL